MPIYRMNEQLIYFAHIPKCAGTSLTEYLEQRFGPPALQDRAHFRDPAPDPWSRTSPQHIDAAALARLFPADFFAHRVAIVRHPVARLASVFQFQQDVQRKIPKWMPFGFWLSQLQSRRSRDVYALDNHPRPQVEFLPPQTKWFKLEDGFDGFINWLDSIEGKARPELAIGHAKKSKRRVTPTDPQKSRIRAMYAADFEAFAYG